MRGMRNEVIKVAKWKEKARRYREERDAYHKRIKELTMSRDHWKSKYKTTQKELLATRQKPPVQQAGQRARPARHRYSIELIRLVLLLRYARCSLRSCLEILQVMSLYLSLELRIPSVSSIRNRERKLGHWRLHQPAWDDAHRAVILDESVNYWWCWG